MTSSHRVLKKPLVLQIPYYPVELEYNELNVKGRWDGEIDWTDIGFIEKVIYPNFYSVQDKISRLWCR